MKAIVVVVIVHLEREEEEEKEEEVAREICILTTRRPVRQWTRKKWLIKAKQRETREIFAHDNAEILLAFSQPRPPLKAQFHGRLTDGAPPPILPILPMIRCQSGIIPANGRAGGDVLIAGLFTPQRLCMTARLSRTAAAAWLNNNCGSACLAAGGGTPKSSSPIYNAIVRHDLSENKNGMKNEA